MKRLTRVLIPTTLLVLLLAPTALAGSVAVVTFAELPSDFDAGTPYTSTTRFWPTAPSRCRSVRHLSTFRGPTARI